MTNGILNERGLKALASGELKRCRQCGCVYEAAGADFRHFGYCSPGCRDYYIGSIPRLSEFVSWLPEEYLEK